MNIDKRYIELLATTTPRKVNKKASRLAAVGFLILLAGGVLFLRGALYGMAIAAAGVILCGISMVLQGKTATKAKQDFLKYVEDNDTLPPWPEKPQEVKQIDK